MEEVFLLKSYVDVRNIMIFTDHSSLKLNEDSRPIYFVKFKEGSIVTSNNIACSKLYSCIDIESLMSDVKELKKMDLHFDLLSVEMKPIVKYNNVSHVDVVELNTLVCNDDLSDTSSDVSDDKYSFLDIF